MGKEINKVNKSFKKLTKNKSNTLESIHDIDDAENMIPFKPPVTNSINYKFTNVKSVSIESTN